VPTLRRGFVTEIDGYEEFEPEGGDLYNLREFAHLTEDSSDAEIEAWADEYWEHQRDLYIAHGKGERGGGGCTRGMGFRPMALETRLACWRLTPWKLLQSGG
jgi:hypothetical protein